MGMSETISAWSWPTLNTIESVSETLSDRISRLNVEIANIEDTAISYAASAEDQAKFFRDAKIAEATFTVLTEQVKSQTLVAGFKPETFTVFAYATPPLAPSSPKKFNSGLGSCLRVLCWKRTQHNKWYATGCLLHSIFNFICNPSDCFIECEFP